MGFPGGDGTEAACSVGDLGWEDSLEKGTSVYPLQYSCLEHLHGQRGLATDMGSQSQTHVSN